MGPFEAAQFQLRFNPSFVFPSAGNEPIPPTVGTPAVLGGQPVYYAGEGYGYQSPESYKKLTGAFPEGYEPKLGAPAVLRGKPVFYAGKAYGYQSPASYKEVVGSLPTGYKPEEAPTSDDETGQGTGAGGAGEGGAGGAAGGGTGGERGGQLEGEGAKQTQEPVVDTVRETLERLSDLGFQEELGRLKTRNLVEAATVLSALRAPRERQKQQAEIERQNIQAWRDMRVAQINANAQQGTALSLAIASSMAPNLGNFGEILKATASQMAARSRG